MDTPHTATRLQTREPATSVIHVVDDIDPAALLATAQRQFAVLLPGRSFAAVRW